MTDAAPSPARVLIVDDEPNILLSLQFLMKKAGYDVRTAKDGEQAWRKSHARSRTSFCST